MSGLVFIVLGVLIVASGGALSRANERWIAGNAVARRVTVLRGRSQRVATRMVVTLFGIGFVLAGVAVLLS